MIDPIQLEKLLMSNWTKFVNVKMLFSLIPEKANQVKISRFEWNNSHFIVWIEFKTNNSIGTTEFNLYSDGSVENVKTIQKTEI